MRQRMVSALVGLTLLAVVYAFFDTLLLNVVIVAVCVLSVWELLRAIGCLQFRGLVVLPMLMALVIPFAHARIVRPFLVQGVYILVLAFFILFIRNFGVIRVEHFAMAGLVGLVVPLFFSCAVYIREDFGTASGGFYLMLALGAAWLCDTCAYFTGMRFGRHKLAPRISPKKTVEGAIGGVLGCTLLMLPLAYAYAAVFAANGIGLQVNYLALGLCTPLFALAGMLGDLSASAVKRQFGVKDFGNIMPGHGGILDRFDSVLFTLPSVYIFVHHVGIVALG